VVARPRFPGWPPAIILVVAVGLLLSLSALRLGTAGGAVATTNGTIAARGTAVALSLATHAIQIGFPSGTAPAAPRVPNSPTPALATLAVATPTPPPSATLPPLPTLPPTPLPTAAPPLPTSPPPAEEPAKGRADRRDEGNDEPVAAVPPPEDPQPPPDVPPPAEEPPPPREGP
jgi:hypothetical protein